MTWLRIFTKCVLAVALLVYDKVGLSRRAISKIKQEPVDPRNYAEEVLE